MSADVHAPMSTEAVAASFAVIMAACMDAVDPDRSPRPQAGNVHVDPEALLQLARWHRILPIVNRTLADRCVALPPALAAALAAEARTARLTAMFNASEEARIAAAAKVEGPDLLFVKGATLGHLLYDDSLSKSSWDIDVLIDPADLEFGCSLLNDLGYVLDRPPGVTDGLRFDRWLKTTRETTWRHPRRGTIVELHIGLSDTPSVLASVGMTSPRQMVSINGVDVPTLADDELFAFLCVHGTPHGWVRLKWLTDVAAFIHRGKRSVTNLRATAITFGAGRCGDVALLLCHELFGLDLPVGLAAVMKRDQATRRLADYSLRQIDRVGDPDRRLAAETVPQILANMRNQYRFAPGFRAGLQTFWAFWNKPSGTRQLWMPKPLLPVVMIVWLPIRVLLRPLRRKLPLPR